jgi:hypothetical protein
MRIFLLWIIATHMSFWPRMAIAQTICNTDNTSRELQEFNISSLANNQKRYHKPAACKLLLKWKQMLDADALAYQQCNPSLSMSKQALSDTVVDTMVELHCD